MPHPIMFDEHDPVLARVRAVALGFPGAFEKVSWGRPVFCAPKMFAIFGGSAKTGGEQVPHPQSLLVKVDESERPALEQDPRFYLPAYLGPFGWLGLDLAAAAVDWTEIGELVDASYRLVAPKRLLRQWDGHQQ
jgi:hypothetical protein